MSLYPSGRFMKSFGATKSCSWDEYVQKQQISEAVDVMNRDIRKGEMLSVESRDIWTASMSNYHGSTRTST